MSRGAQWIISTHKQAWEEAFEHRHEGWGDDMAQRLGSEELPYLQECFRQALRDLDLKGKSIAQFCCNNGREILSAMQLGAAKGVGFDIAENMIEHGRKVARQAKIPCEFAACNIMEIGAEYDGAFDLIFFTIGAITWFQDLEALFQVAARCLKPGGTLLIHDFHPFINMLPLPGEEPFDPEKPDRVGLLLFPRGAVAGAKQRRVYVGASKFAYLYQLFAYDGEHCQRHHRGGP